MSTTESHGGIVVAVDGSPSSLVATDWAAHDDDLHAWTGIDWDRQLEVGKEALAERLAGWQAVLLALVITGSAYLEG